MMNYPVDPEYCLIIHALRESDSLRSAARLLGMEPAHLTRKIQKFSSDDFLLQKIGNRWTLTDKGYRIAEWVDQTMLSQQVLLEERTALRISCYTWLGEQMLIPGLQRLAELTHNKFAWRLNVVATDLEKELISGQTDYVITCHAPNDPLVAHKVFNPDPWYIVVPKAWEKKVKTLKGDALIAFLNTKPFLRLTTLNPDQSLGFTPRTMSDFMIDGVLGVRAAVVNGLGWACLPSLALTDALKKSDLVKVNLESMTTGNLSVWWLRSRKDNFSNIPQLSKWLKEISN